MLIFVESNDYLNAGRSNHEKAISEALKTGVYHKLRNRLGNAAKVKTQS